jgi:hypothetical protein
MKAWLISVALLFVLAEFSLWLANFLLPLPIYVLGAALLAIASNYERGIVAMFRQQINLNPETISQTATLIEPTESIAPASPSLLQSEDLNKGSG